MNNIGIDTFRMPPTRTESRLTVQQLLLLKIQNILPTAPTKNLIRLIEPIQFTFRLI